MRYKCTRAFSIPTCDENGFVTEQDMIIEDGTVWELADPDHNFIGGEVRLEIVDPTSGRWLEITGETLKVYFEEVLGDG